MFTIEALIGLIAIFLMYLLLDKFIHEFPEVNIIYSGLTMYCVFYMLKTYSTIIIVSKIFNILGWVSLFLIVVFLIYYYVDKITNRNKGN